MPPFCGTHIGRTEIRRAFDALDTECEVCDMAGEDMIVEGSRAVVRWRATIRHRGTAVSASFGGVSFFRFRDDLIEELALFFDVGCLPLIEQIFDLREGG
jgi:hypothetical protein